MTDQVSDHDPAERVEAPSPALVVEFDDGDTDVMRVDWASRGLRWLRKRRPQAFMDMMQYGVFRMEEPARRPRGPKPGNHDARQ